MLENIINIIQQNGYYIWVFIKTHKNYFPIKLQNICALHGTLSSCKRVTFFISINLFLKKIKKEEEEEEEEEEE